jgi:hypothetical protein
MASNCRPSSVNVEKSSEISFAHLFTSDGLMLRTFSGRRRRIPHKNKVAKVLGSVYEKFVFVRNFTESVAVMGERSLCLDLFIPFEMSFEF